MTHLLTFPDAGRHALSIRAKALVFEDPQSQELLLRLDQVAPTEATVLIIGETGTGKELLARRVHQGSGRSGPFVAVNCGAFSEALIDAELFGHESGAFTGASQARPGWFEAANGGTLFLDEIGDLPLALQVKLLRVLQERQVVRIGSRKPISVDVRLVAATNVRLEDAVQAGHFRSDLYYRLSVAVLELTPLCHRPGDILPLAKHFLQDYGSRLNISLPRLAEDAEQALLAHDWPGNIRELENVIHFALIVAPSGLVRAADLQAIRRTSARRPSLTGPYTAIPVIDSVQAEPAADSPEDLDRALQDVLLKWFERGGAASFERLEASTVRTAFQFCESNQVQTARMLGITRNVLRTLLKRHGLIQADGASTENTVLAFEHLTNSASQHLQ